MGNLISTTKKLFPLEVGHYFIEGSEKNKPEDV